jgi:hypothetical protein
MTKQQLDLIRKWDAKCGDNEATFFPVTMDRRRLIEYVDELRELLERCREHIDGPDASALKERIEAAIDR